MNRNRWTLAAAVLLLLLGAALLVREGGAAGAACACLRSLHYDESDPEACPARLDPVDTNPAGQVTCMEINSNAGLELLAGLIGRAEGTRRVDAVPRLSYPRLRCGEYLRGNWEKLYYTDPRSRRITEFTLGRADAMALAVRLVPFGRNYPEIQEYFAGELAEQLYPLLPEEGADVFRRDENGFLESVEIRERETLDRYLACVRNSACLSDMRDWDCGPWLLSPTVQVGEETVGNCEFVTFTSPSTGIPLYIGFEWKEGQALAAWLSERAGARNPYTGE